MTQFTRRFTRWFYAAALLLATGCAGGLGGAGVGGAGVPPANYAPPALASLPPVGLLDTLRGASSFERMGDVILTSEDAVRFKEVGYPNYYYRLTGNDVAPSWVVARFGPDWGDYSVPESVDYFWVTQDQAAVGGWYGVADFAAGCWRWQRAEPLDGAPEHSRRYCDDVQNPVSPTGCVYLAVVAFGVGDSASPPERPKVAFPETVEGEQ